MTTIITISTVLWFFNPNLKPKLWFQIATQGELQSGRKRLNDEEDRFEEERTEMRSRIEELEKDLRVARQSRDANE